MTQATSQLRTVTSTSTVRPARRWLNYAFVTLRCAFGGMLIWASISKIIDPVHFLTTIQGYRLLPEQVEQVIAVILPWAEFLLGVCMISGTMLGGVWLATGLLFAIFAVAHASVLVRGLSIPCGCGLSSDADHISVWTLSRSLVLLGVATICWLHQWILSRPGRNPVNLMSTLTTKSP